MRQIWYHADCHDGFAAAWCFWNGMNRLDLQFTPVKYGRPAPAFQQVDEIYIVDFSYPRGVLETIKANCKKLVVLDHHKTAQAELTGLDYCTFDLSKSGATLAWEYLFDAAPPIQIQLIEDRDLWKFRFDQTKPFSAGLRLLEMDFEVWDEVMSEAGGFKETVEAGTTVLRYEKMLVDRLLEEVNWMSIEGYRVPVVNATSVVSELGEAMLRRFPEANFSASYRDVAGNRRSWSLRSRTDFDCSVIAKQFGGGGHAQASGFVISDECDVQIC